MLKSQENALFYRRVWQGLMAKHDLCDKLVHWDNDTLVDDLYKMHIN